MNYLVKASKVLSKNDTGETNSHQSGISIIKEIAKAGIFPVLDSSTLNPRIDVNFVDEQNNIWKFTYIYYNDHFFGKPGNKGHNEYRLTRVKNFIRQNSILAGDTIWFAIGEDGNRYIGFLSNNKLKENDQDKNVIHIKGGWKIVKI